MSKYIRELPEPSQPLFLLLFSLTKKGKRKDCFYFRLLSAIAAAITTIMTTAAAIAMYVDAGIPLLG